MENKYKIDKSRIECELNSFASYVNYRNNGSGSIDFREKSTFPGNEEEYKVEVAKEAEKVLNFERWDESQIGTSKIYDAVRNAMTVKNQNLVDYRQLNRFQVVCEANYFEAEQVLFNIYRGDSDEESFTKAVKAFGAKYDLIAYLFYIKTPDKYLPIHSRDFEKGLRRLDIDYELCGKCSWNNYIGFIDIISEIQQIMNEHLPLKEKNSIRLIDAHSFVWIISQDAYVDWPHDYEYAIEMGLCNNNYQDSEAGTVRKSTKNVTSYYRDSAVAQRAKKQANGICQLCRNPAPFKDNDGQPYLEAHHIQWLSRGGRDIDKNVVALCPNCHRKMHVIDDQDDKNRLLSLKNPKKHNQ